LTVWIFAVAVSLTKAGTGFYNPVPAFACFILTAKPSAFGKTVCTTAAAAGRLCGGSVSAPPAPPEEQKKCYAIGLEKA